MTCCGLDAVVNMFAHTTKDFWEITVLNQRYNYYAIVPHVGGRNTQEEQLLPAFAL